MYRKAIVPFIDTWILYDPRKKKPCGNARKVKLPPQTLQDKRHHHHGRPKPKTLAGLELNYNKGYELNQRIPWTPLCSLLAAGCLSTTCSAMQRGPLKLLTWTRIHVLVDRHVIVSLCARRLPPMGPTVHSQAGRPESARSLLSRLARTDAGTEFLFFFFFAPSLLLAVVVQYILPCLTSRSIELIEVLAQLMWKHWDIPINA
jgi:hypothetical protein